MHLALTYFNKLTVYYLSRQESGNSVLYHCCIMHSHMIHIYQFSSCCCFTCQSHNTCHNNQLIDHIITDYCRNSNHLHRVLLLADSIISPWRSFILPLELLHVLARILGGFFLHFVGRLKLFYGLALFQLFVHYRVGQLKEQGLIEALCI